MKCHTYYMGGSQILGRRENQEDAYLLSSEGGPTPPPEASGALPGPVYAVLADGMGGAQDGEIASATVSRAAMRALQQSSTDMARVAAVANETLRLQKQGGSPHADAGSTLIAATFRDGYLSWASVGDSLLLLYRGNQLTLLNRQHIMALRLQEQVRRGEITPQQANAFPQPQALYSAVCGDDLEEVDAPAPFKTEHGDRFIIASDGLHALTQGELRELLESYATCDPSYTVQAILDAVAAKGRPTQDNTTVIVVDYFYEERNTAGKEPSTRIIRRPTREGASGKWCIFSQSIFGDRPSQQDRRDFHVNEKALLAAVIDGAGGVQGGELAAQVACDEVQRLWEQSLRTAPLCCDAQEIIRSFLIEAHEAVKSRAIVPSGNGKAAIVLLYACGNEICVGNVGDCRCYMLAKRRWMQLSEDDSLLALQVKMGAVSESEAWHHPDQSRLTQALGGDRPPTPHVSVHPISPRDSFLLCCDGLWGQLHPTKWQHVPVYSGDFPPDRVLQQWVQQAQMDANGDSDNVTAILVCPNLSPSKLANTNPVRSERSMPLSAYKKLFTILTTLLVCICVAGGGFYFSGNTSLTGAAEKGNESIVRLLLACGANIESKNSQGATPLMLAVEKGHEAVVRLLLERGAKINSQDKESATPLHVASRSGHTEMVDLLLSKGADPTVKNKAEKTAWDLAEKEEIKKLLRKSMLRREIEEERSRGKTTNGLLLEAAEKGKSDVVEFLIDKYEAKIDATDNDGWTPLMCAVDKGNEAVVRLLLDKGANIEAKTDNGWTPLMLAVEKGHEAVVRLLLEKGAKIEATTNDGWTPLMLAVEKGHEAVVRLLLERDAKINSQDKKGATPLLLAAASGKTNIARILLEKSADVRISAEDGSTPLHEAAKQGYGEMVELLLSNGADPTAKNKAGKTAWDLAEKEEIKKLLRKAALRRQVAEQLNSGKTRDALLLEAAEKGESDVVEFLIDEHGAKIDATDNDGWTPLMLAVEKGHEAVVRLLLEKGANIKASTNDGWTPLIIAAWNGHEAVVRLLLEKGAKIEVKDCFGFTPLYWAACNGHEAVVRLLLDKDAKIEAKNDDGWTPLIIAASNGHEAVVRLLLEKGANINAKDKYGDTPLSWAAKFGYEAIVRLLLEKGADPWAKDNDGLTAYDVAETDSIKRLIRSYQR